MGEMILFLLHWGRVIQRDYKTMGTTQMTLTRRCYRPKSATLALSGGGQLLRDPHSNTVS